MNSFNFASRSCHRAIILVDDFMQFGNFYRNKKKPRRPNCGQKSSDVSTEIVDKMILQE